MIDRNVRFASGATWLCGMVLSIIVGQTSSAMAQSVRLASGSGADGMVVPANEPRAHLHNLSNAVWTKALEAENPTRPPIRLISGDKRYPFGQYGANGRYPFGMQYYSYGSNGRYPFGVPYYSYGPTNSPRSYGQYPVPRPAPPPATLPAIPWGIGGYEPGYWGYGWNGYGYGGYAPATWSYGGWGAPVPPGWGYVPVAPTWGPAWPGY
jgi:hypothetical protein